MFAFTQRIYNLLHQNLFTPSYTTLNDTPIIQPLLFRHSLILVLIIGFISAKFPLQGYSSAFILFWIDSRYWGKKPLILFIIIFFLGIVIGFSSKPKQPDYTPLWLSTCLEKHKPIRITGTIKHTKSAPNHRLHITLENVLPELPEQVTYKMVKPKPLPCNLLLTWEEPPLNIKRPLPGQKITATVTIRFLRGFRNNDTYNIANYWHQQNTYFQAWSKNSAGDIFISGTPHTYTSIRENLYQQLTRHILNYYPYDKLQNNTDTFEYITPGKSFIPALLFGDRFFLSNSLYTLTCYSGIAHSLALSGQHLAIVGIIASLFITIFSKPYPRMFTRIPRYNIFPFIAMPFAFIYLWLGNAPLSLTRATFMMFIWSIYKIKKTTVMFIDVILIALCSILLLDPQNIYSVALQLSFIAVIGISFASPFLYSLLKVAQHKPIIKIRPSLLQKSIQVILSIFFIALGVTIVAQIVTFPLSLYLFGYTSPWFLLNVIWLPILNIFILPFAFLSLFFCIISFPTIANYCITFASFPCEILIHFLTKLNQKGFLEPLWLPRPHWTEVLGLYLILLAISIIPGRVIIPSVVKRIFIASFIMLMVSPISQYLLYDKNRIRLRVMDVGQGQAVLLEWGENKRALIDAGGFYSKTFDTGKDILSPVLTANHPLQLEFIALTHPHSDHLKGFLFLAKTFQINQAYSALLPTIDIPIGKPSMLATQFDAILKKRAVPRYIVARGDRIYLEQNLFLEILSPAKGILPKGNTGIIFRLVSGDRGLAFIPGDAEYKDLKELLKTKLNLQADVLILPHHGSKTGLIPEFYQAVQPLVAIASTGVLNKHNFPSPSIHKMLLNYDIPLRTTAQEGEIMFEWEHNTFQ